MGTTADGSVITNLALSKLAAGANARIATLEVKAGQLVVAVVVVLALALLAENEGVTLMTRWAFAVGVVTVPDALRILTARAGVAWVRLLFAPGDGVWVGDIACDALAHWVPSKVHLAASVWSAGAGIARIWRRSSDDNP